MTRSPDVNSVTLTKTLTLTRLGPEVRRAAMAALSSVTETEELNLEMLEANLMPTIFELSTLEEEDVGDVEGSILIIAHMSIYGNNH